MIISCEENQKPFKKQSWYRHILSKSPILNPPIVKSDINTSPPPGQGPISKTRNLDFSKLLYGLRTTDDRRILLRRFKYLPRLTAKKMKRGVLERTEQYMCACVLYSQFYYNSSYGRMVEGGQFVSFLKVGEWRERSKSLTLFLFCWNSVSTRYFTPKFRSWNIEIQ